MLTIKRNEKDLKLKGYHLISKLQDFSISIKTLGKSYKLWQSNYLSN